MAKRSTPGLSVVLSIAMVRAVFTLHLIISLAEGI